MDDFEDSRAESIIKGAAIGAAIAFVAHYLWGLRRGLGIFALLAAVVWAMTGGANAVSTRMFDKMVFTALDSTYARKNIRFENEHMSFDYGQGSLSGSIVNDSGNTLHMEYIRCDARVWHGNIANKDTETIYFYFNRPFTVKPKSSRDIVAMSGKAINYRPSDGVDWPNCTMHYKV